jgi:hypothetical protein
MKRHSVPALTRKKKAARGIPGSLSPGFPRMPYCEHVRENTLGNREMEHSSCLSGENAINGPGDNAMITNHTNTDKTGTGHVAHHARKGHSAEPHQMPAGGWLKDIAMSENWRTTTIVQRHRDRATTTPSL